MGGRRRRTIAVTISGEARKFIVSRFPSFLALKFRLNDVRIAISSFVSTHISITSTRKPGRNGGTSGGRKQGRKCEGRARGNVGRDERRDGERRKADHSPHLCIPSDPIDRYKDRKHSIKQLHQPLRDHS